MSEMVDRVARALRQHKARLSDSEAGVLARAAIEAMREPTQEMLERGCTDMTNLTMSGPSERLGKRTAGERLADGYRAMIDAALGKLAPLSPDFSEP